MKNSSKKININNLYLGSILKYEGIKKANLNLIKNWTFVTYIIVSKESDGTYSNALNRKEKYPKMRYESEFDLDEEALDIIANAKIILGDRKIKFSSTDIIEAMKKSDLYFEDALDKKYDMPSKKMVKTK